MEKRNLHGYVDARLADLAHADADSRGVPVSEIIAAALAAHYNRPDLAAVPRKRLGRPRKDAAPVADAAKPAKEKGRSK